MRLTEQEQAMLNGEFGPGFARAMRVLVGIGKAFGAQRMVPVSRGHISLSNQEGDLWFVSQMLEEGAHCRVPPTVSACPWPVRLFVLMEGVSRRRTGMGLW